MVKPKDTNTSAQPPATSADPVVQAKKDWKQDLTPEELKKEAEREIKRDANAKKAAEKQKHERENKEKQDEKAKKEELDAIRLARKYTKDPRNTGIVYVENGCVIQDIDGTELAEEIWVSQDYYCMWCGAQLSLWHIESHVESVKHKKKLAWIQAEAQSKQPLRLRQDSAEPSGDLTVARNEPWDTNIFEECTDEWGGKFWRCMACDKVADESHCASKMHLNRVETWKEMDQLKVQPREEWLMWVFGWGQSNEEHDMGVKCLLCDKFCQDGVTAYNHGQDLDSASKVHKSRIQNYDDYREGIRDYRAEMLQEDATGKLREIVERQTEPLFSFSEDNCNSKKKNAHNNQKQASSRIFAARTQPRVQPTQPVQLPPYTSPSPDPSQGQEPLASYTHVATDAYDGVEMMKDGLTEFGYLVLTKGDRLCMMDTELVNGEEYNNFSQYGFFQNERGDQGWAPTLCVAESCS